MNDIISKPITARLQFGKSKSTQSVFGGVVSILVYVFIAFLAYSKSLDILDHKYFYN